MTIYQDLLTELQGLSASGSGTAIFYSGNQQIDGQTVYNSTLAEQCAANIGGYTIFDTQAGQFLNGTVKAAFNNGSIDQAQYQNLWNIASQMLAQQAQGNVIAIVDGTLDANSVFVNYELPTLLANNTSITSINGVNISTLDIVANGNPLNNEANLVSYLAGLSDDFCNGIPPSASAPVTATDYIQDDTASQYTSSNAQATAIPQDNSNSTVSSWLTSGAMVYTALGVLALGTAIRLKNPAAFIAAISLFSQAAEAQTQPVSSTSQSINSDDDESYQALEFAPAYAEMRTEAIVAAGLLPESAISQLPSVSANFQDLVSALQSNGGTLHGGEIELPSGQLINVGVSTDNNGNIVYAESAADSNPDGYDLNDGNQAISSQTDTFNTSGQNINDIFNITSGGSQNNQFTYNADGTITETTNNYSNADLGGTLQFTQVTDFDVSGNSTAADISGTGDNTTLGGTTITIENNTTATINGTSNTILVDSNDNITVAADPNNASAGVQDTIQVNSADSNGIPDLTTDTITFDNQSIAATNLTSGSAAQNGLTYTLNGSTLSITDSNSDSLTINNFQNGDFGVDMAPVTTVPGAQTVSSGTLTNISGISVNSADGSNGTITVTLSDTSGILNVNANVANDNRKYILIRCA